MEVQKRKCRAVWTQSSLFDLVVVKVISTQKIEQSREDTCVSEADGGSKRTTQNSLVYS
jgi:hypothetical protein